ncbi:MAG TPA: hypothetical protein VJV41_12030 [Mycobacterium sp.]|nr:hypothetical protein [Mycobacterium sp.]
MTLEIVQASGEHVGRDAEIAPNVLEPAHPGEQVAQDQRRPPLPDDINGARYRDAMVLELDDAGLIRRIRPHLRPLLATILFTLLLGPKLVSHPGVVRRALLRRPEPAA